MPVLENRSYREGADRPASYSNSVLLAANVPETFSVPQDNATQAYARFLRLAATDNVYVKLLKSGFDSDVVIEGDFTEHVTNGAFSADTDWTKGTGWTIAAGVADAAGAISTALSQTSAVTLIEGRTYTITYTVARTAGSVTPSIGGTAGTARSSSATFTETIVAGSTQILAFTGTGFTGTIDDVSVTPWELGTGWTTTDVATATGAISTALTQTVSNLIEGQTYYVTYTATRSAGTVTVQVGGTAGTGRTTSATFSEFIVAGSDGTIGFTTSGFTGTVDDFSVIPAAQVPGDVTNGYAAHLYSKDMPHNILLDGNVTKVSVVSAGTPIVTAGFAL